MSTAYASFVGAPEATLCEFLAEGFPESVPGVVYRNGRLGRGIPLGGLGTGYLELTGDGRLGDTTVFNHFPAAYTWTQPPRLDQPFLTVRCESQVRVLALAHDAPAQENFLGSARFAQDLAYWGHYPFAELAYETDLPLDIRLRAWSPFIPGDADGSNTPAAVFELSLTNRSPNTLEVEVAFVFPALQLVEGTVYRRVPIEGRAVGVATMSERYGRDVGYALRVAGAERVETGAPIGVSSRPWSDMGARLPRPLDDEPGTTVIGRVRLEAKQCKVVVFTLSWFYPSFQVGFAFPYEHMYGRRFESAVSVSQYVDRNLTELRERSLGWQRAVYRQELPAFLCDGLVNGLYCLAKNSWWTCASGTDDLWGPSGLFTVNESFRDCPVTETVPCRFYGHYPLLMFFPELEKTTLCSLANFQLRSGEIPFALAYGSGLFDPRYHCVHPLNSSMFVQMLYRYYLRTGDARFLRRMLPAAKAAIRFLNTLDDDGDGLVNEHPHALPGTPWPANNYHDTFPWYGTSVYTAGMWLATLRAAAAIGRILGDEPYARRCDECFAKGAEALERKLWAGDRYLVYSDPNTDRRLDASLLNQLVGEWCSRQLGLGGVFPADHVEETVESILHQNVALGAAAPIDTVDRAGRPVDLPEMGSDPAAHQASACMVSEAICFAMTLLWQGRRTEGLAILEAIWKAHAIDHRTPFEQYYLIGPEDGKPIWGNDYYPNMVIWAVPMALAAQDIVSYASSPLITECIEASSRIGWPGSRKVGAVQHRDRTDGGR